MWELAAAGMHMCSCSYCFLCSQFAAAVETAQRFQLYHWNSLGKGEMCDCIIGVAVPCLHGSDMERKQCHQMLCMPTTNPDLTTKFWAQQ